MKGMRNTQRISRMADKIYWTDKTEENGYERREWVRWQALMREAPEAT
jgi:hypothetical protein